MAGIGKYTKGAKFTLKSGNSSAFKNLGSSPMKQGKIPVDLHQGESHRRNEYIGIREGRKINYRKIKENARKKDAKEAREYFVKHGHRRPTEWEKIKSDFTGKSEKSIVTKKKSPTKQTDTTYADRTKKSKREQDFAERYTAEKAKDKYWYKINNKAATKAQYMAYKNKPGGDEPGKQTNDPTVSLAKQSASKRK